MSVFNEVLSVEQALNRQLPVWDVILRGVGAAVPDPTAFTIYPALGDPALPSAFALAIGPRSTFDRCWVEWDPQVKVVVAGAEVQTKDFIRRLSIDAPLIFQQLGNRGTSTGGTVIDPISAIRVADSPARFGITNRDDSNDIILLNSFLPTAIGSVTPTEPIFVSLANDVASPQLHLVLYLAESLPPPTKRFPARYVVDSIDVPITSPPGGAQYIRTIPVMGRKHIRVDFWSDPADGTMVYTGIVGGLNPVNGGGSSVPGFDNILGSVAGVASTAPKTVLLDNPTVDYINLYAQPTSGGAGAMTAIVNVYD